MYTPVYVNINSNHPKIIIDNMQPVIERRISSLSSNRDIFHGSAPIYNNALQAAGYTGNIKFKNLQKTNPEPAKQHRNKRRNRHVIWFHILATIRFPFRLPPEDVAERNRTERMFRLTHPFNLNLFESIRKWNDTYVTISHSFDQTAHVRIIHYVGFWKRGTLNNSSKL